MVLLTTEHATFSDMKASLAQLQHELVILTNPHMFADTSGLITDHSGVSTAEQWQLEVAKDKIKEEKGEEKDKES